MKLSVVMPVYNEINTIGQILSRVSSVVLPGIKKEIIVVDDFSTDGTREFLAEVKSGKVKVVFHEKNMGKGCAVRTGLRHATGDIIIFQDADVEYDPNDYGKLIQPIVDGKADVVFGSRFLGKSLSELGHGRLVLPAHFMGNKILTFITNIFYGQKLTDMETGYKVFRGSVIKGLDFRANRFDMEPEITSKLLKRRVKVVEVPIRYFARDFSQGKKITWKDGMKAAWCLVKFRFVD
ncbi:glycosyltransferase family 2 protein [Candidatus Woesearchaeota archaeon]|nr:glycosyltransferase family 2 protein [Candidatus Woesearchaeota archaeon]